MKDAYSMQEIVDEYHAGIHAELLSGDPEFALRLIGRMVTEMPLNKPSGYLQEPLQPLPDVHFTVLFKTAIRYSLLKAGLSVPSWTDTEALQPEWFPYSPFSDAYRELIIRETPAVFSQAGIFIRERSLMTV